MLQMVEVSHSENTVSIFYVVVVVVIVIAQETALIVHNKRIV